MLTISKDVFKGQVHLSVVHREYIGGDLREQQQQWLTVFTHSGTHTVGLFFLQILSRSISDHHLRACNPVKKKVPGFIPHNNAVAVIVCRRVTYLTFCVL